MSEDYEMNRSADEPCPTPCDPDCDAYCHEAHQPAWKRDHQHTTSSDIEVERWN